MTLADIEFEIIKLELKAGDTLALWVNHPLTQAQIRELQKAAEKLIPDGVKVMVVAWPMLRPEVIKAS
jgi:hypothetical protein